MDLAVSTSYGLINERTPPASPDTPGITTSSGVIRYLVGGRRLPARAAELLLDRWAMKRKGFGLTWGSPRGYRRATRSSPHVGTPRSGIRRVCTL